MDRGMAGGAIRRFGVELAVPGGCHDVATEAKIGNALGRQHVPADGTVRFVAARTTLDSGGTVFVQKRAAFVGMAFKANFLFKPAQALRAGLGRMGIMAGGTFEDAFLEAMPLVELELGHDILMARRADLAGLFLEEGRLGLAAMDAVAGTTVHRGQAVRAGHKGGLVLGVTGQTLIVLYSGKFGRFEGQKIGPAAFLHMLGRAGMTGGAGILAGRGMRIPGECLDLVLMAVGAGDRSRGGSGTWPRGRQDGDAHGESQTPRQSECERDRFLRATNLHFQTSFNNL